MRWKKNKRLWEKYDMRAVKRFALFPIICRQYFKKRVVAEVRWLKVVYVAQEYELSWSDHWWKNRYFITKKEYEQWIVENDLILRGVK